MAIYRNKGKRLEKYLNRYIVFDLETTGTNIYKDKIIEISAIKIENNQVIEKFNTLVNPQCRIPYGASRINHITDDMVKNNPIIDDVLPDFILFIEDYPLVGYNITTFDLNIIYDLCLEKYGMILNNDYVDIYYMAKKYITSLERYRLVDVCKYCQIDHKGAHRALKDCYMTNDVYYYLRDHYL